MNTLAAIGRTFYAVAIVAFGILHVAFGDFVTRVVPWWPAWIPGRTLWVYAVGAVLVAAGTAILVNRRTHVVATALGAAMLLSFALLGLPLAARDSLLGGRWTWAGKALALSGGAFLVAASAVASGSARSQSASPNALVTHLWSAAPWFFASFLVLCGIQHFIHVEFVKSLVPTWIPGALVWTYAAGVALMAGGIGLLLPVTASLAGLLSGLMIFTWVFIVHLPRAVNTFPRSTNETTAVFEAVAMSGIAWLAAVQASRRHRENSATVPRRAEKLESGAVSVAERA